MIQLNNVGKSFGEQVLFEDVTLHIGSNEKVGLIGRNGSGKSTLFKILQGEIAPDSGTIGVPSHYRIAALEQHIHFTKSSVLEECIQALPETEKWDHYKAEKILFGLGFEGSDMDRPPSEFSGGYQIRMNLTKCLLSNPNLLLLDEPTNYLDIVSLRWLRKFLQQFQGEVIIITHDKDFMDSVVTHTAGIYRQQVKKIEGNTNKFREQVALEDELYEQTRVKAEAKKKELQLFVDRFKAKASKATQAQSKMKQIEKLGNSEKLAAENNIGLQFQFEKCPGKVPLELKDISFAHPDGELLFENLDFEVARTDRVGIIGKNGKGKSTLLNLIAKELSPTTGHLKEHPSLLKGHFGQTNIQRLKIENTIVEEVAEANPSLSHTELRKICGSLMFTGSLADKKIKVLSGGERSRVLLAKILAHKTNLLLLDEPTNHLDMESVEVLADELTTYQGAVVLVTHNEMLLRKTVNKLVIFQHGTAELFLGSYDDFLDNIGWEEEGPQKRQKKPKWTKKRAGPP